MRRNDDITIMLSGKHKTLTITREAYSGTYRPPFIYLHVDRTHVSLMVASTIVVVVCSQKSGSIFFDLTVVFWRSREMELFLFLVNTALWSSMHEVARFRRSLDVALELSSGSTISPKSCADSN